MLRFLTGNSSSQQAIVIGGSAGSVQVIAKILRELRPPGIPVFISLHRLASDENSNLRNVLQYYTAMPVIEPKGGDKIENNKIYLAPANRHLIVERNYTFTLSEGERVKFSRPSVDMLFMSASEVYGKNLTGILLTGYNDDGAEGMKKIKEMRGTTIIQNLLECVATVMPKSAMKITQIDHEFTLAEIASFINHKSAGKTALRA